MMFKYWLHLEEKRWIQKAVDSSHRGYCTPMSKKTCTPRRKALARRFKRGGDLHEAHLRRPPIDRDAFPDRGDEGLEGPFTFGGRVLYYDPMEGKYYDSRQDMYISDDEIQMLKNYDHEAMNKYGSVNPYPPGHPANR